MTTCLSLTRWGALQSRRRCAVHIGHKVCQSQRLFAADQSVTHELRNKSLTENEFLDFVLGSTQDKHPTDDTNPRSLLPKDRNFLGSESKLKQPSKSEDDVLGRQTRLDNKEISRGRRRRVSPKRDGSLNVDRKAGGTLVGYVKSMAIVPRETTEQPRRIRWLSLRHRTRPSADVSTAWTVNFARLTNRYDSLQTMTVEPILDVELDDRAGLWAEQLLETIDQKDSDRVGFLDINEFQDKFGERGRGVWREVTLWLLAHRKDRVLDFLLATHVGPYYPPMNWVSDTLYHLALHLNSVDVEDRSQIVRNLINAFDVLSKRMDSIERMEMQNGFVRRLLPFCTVGQAEQLYSTLKHHGVQVHARTLHHLSRYFAKHDRLEKGIEALLEARALGSNVNGYIFRSNCTTLLRTAMRHPGGQRIGLRLVDNLLKMGVYLDKQLRGIVMLNAVDSGDFDTALVVYESMLASGIKPDAQTYGILLKGCRSNIEDTATLTGIIDRAIKQTDVRQNSILSTQILHCLCLHHNKHRNGFSTIKEAYAQLFEKTPLEKLGINMQTEHTLIRSDTGQLMPSSYDVAIMLSSYLRDASTAETKRLYDSWRRLVLDGDDFFVNLAAKPFLPNTFIYKFISNKASLVEATRVVKDMQTPLPLSTGDQLCAPDIYTWSMLVHGFTRFNETRHAERVLGKMQELGYQPNSVTWNTLLTGYVSNQDIEGTLETLRRLEESDTVYNEWTYRGLSRLSERNRMKLKNEMDRRRYVRKIDFTGDLKQGLTGKLESLESNKD